MTIASTNFIDSQIYDGIVAFIGQLHVHKIMVETKHYKNRFIIAANAHFKNWKDNMVEHTIKRMTLEETCRRVFIYLATRNGEFKPTAAEISVMINLLQIK